MTELTTETLKEAMNSKQLVIVEFWAPWCKPCTILSPKLELLSNKHKDIGFAKLNVDEYEDAAENLNIRGIPTTIAFKEGKEVSRVVGFKWDEILNLTDLK